MHKRGNYVLTSYLRTRILNAYELSIFVNIVLETSNDSGNPMSFLLLGDIFLLSVFK